MNSYLLFFRVDGVEHLTLVYVQAVSACESLLRSCITDRPVTLMRLEQKTDSRYVPLFPYSIDLSYYDTTIEIDASKVSQWNECNSAPHSSIILPEPLEPLLPAQIPLELSDQVACTHCSELTAAPMLVGRRGDPYCQTCYEDHCCQCNDCDTHILSDDAHETNDSELVCQRCRDNHYFLCGYCESLHSQDQENYIETDEMSVCHSCLNSHFIECRACQELTARNDTTRIGDGRYCPNCSDDYSECESCGSVYNNDDLDEGRCHNCQKPDGLHSYSYKPDPEFHPMRDPQFDSYPEKQLGIELEVESSNSSSQEEICDIASRVMGSAVYCKEDGSLSNGVEIVSHPYAIKKFPFSKLRELCKKLQKNGARSYEPGTCGIHVHISRRGLNTLKLSSRVSPTDARTDLEKRLWLGVSILSPFLAPLSKRQNFSYCQFPSSNDLRDFESHRCIRYSAINFSNRDTIEIRFFRGTLNPDSCVNSIKLSYELVVFLSEKSLSSLERLKMHPSKLWFYFLNSLSPHLRQWALERSETQTTYERMRITLKDKLPISKDNKKPIIQEIQEACA